MCSLFVIGEICADPPRHHHDERLISHVHPTAAANKFIRGVPCERAVRVCAKVGFVKSGHVERLKGGFIAYGEWADNLLLFINIRFSWYL